MSWTDERVDLLKQLWTAGHSASQIAEKLGGVSRNAVIGKVHRLKLESRVKIVEAEASVEAAPVQETPKPKPPVAPEPVVNIREEAATVEMVVPARLVSAVSQTRAMPQSYGATALKMEPEEEFGTYEDNEVDEDVEAASDVVVPIARKLSLIQLTDRTCKWPIGDPLKDDFHFCGNGSKDSSPYCDFHAKLAFQAIERRRR